MMFEYAISPSLFNSEDRVALFASTLGMDHGRLVSDYPKDKWEQLALAIIKQRASGEFQLRAWKECLIGMRKRGVLVRRPSATWVDGKNWSENALGEHQRFPFRAIVDEQPNPECASVVSVGLPMLNSPLWGTPGSEHIERKAVAITSKMSSLLNLSGTIVLIDRNFCIDGRFTNVLGQLLQYVSKKKLGPKVTQIKYVVSDAIYRSDEMEDKCRQFLPALIPQGYSVKFYIEPKRALHDRFLLTEKGGLQFGEGLDEGDGEVLVQRLGYTAWTKEWGEWEQGCYCSFEVIP